MSRVLRRFPTIGVGDHGWFGLTDDRCTRTVGWREGEGVVVRFGITGHQILPKAVADLAVGYWTRALSVGPDLCAVSSLADGADQLFAEHVLHAGGQLEAIVPCTGYSQSFSTDAARARFKRLRQVADVAVARPYPQPSQEAFPAAGLIVVEHCDHLFAIWDGHPARGLGGTADVVAYARTRARQVTILWPKGLAQISMTRGASPKTSGSAVSR